MKANINICAAEWDINYDMFICFTHVQRRAPQLYALPPGSGLNVACFGTTGFQKCIAQETCWVVLLIRVTIVLNWLLSIYIETCQSRLHIKTEVHRQCYHFMVFYNNALLSCFPIKQFNTAYSRNSFPLIFDKLWSSKVRECMVC